VEGTPSKGDSEGAIRKSQQKSRNSQALSVEERAKEIFRRLDTDNDGELTREEFVEGYLKSVTCTLLLQNILYITICM